MLRGVVALAIKATFVVFFVLAIFGMLEAWSRDGGPCGRAPMALIYTGEAFAPVCLIVPVP